MSSLKVVGAANPNAAPAGDEIETLQLNENQYAYLDRQSKGINPDMPVAFGAPHAVRTLLERIEESGLDLTPASTEEEIAQLAAAALRPRDAQRR